MGATRPTITIRRSIRITVPGLQLKNQCGRPGQTEFDVHIKATVRELDEQGFVCDNFAIEPEFRKHFGQHQWEASCEDLAGTAIFILHRLCKNRALHIEAEVSPIEVAGVTVEWRKGWAMPSFFAKKVAEAEKNVLDGGIRRGKYFLVTA